MTIDPAKPGNDDEPIDHDAGEMEEAQKDAAEEREDEGGYQ